MASDNYALNFVEYMKGVGDSAVNLAKEGASSLGQRLYPMLLNCFSPHGGRLGGG